MKTDLVCNHEGLEGARVGRLKKEDKNTRE
jgi:hypothetical protein